MSWFFFKDFPRSSHCYLKFFAFFLFLGGRYTYIYLHYMYKGVEKVDPEDISRNVSDFSPTFAEFHWPGVRRGREEAEFIPTRCKKQEFQTYISNFFVSVHKLFNLLFSYHNHIDSLWHKSTLEHMYYEIFWKNKCLKIV